MIDKTCHQFENMVENPVPPAGISSSRILANNMGYDIKGGTNQNSTNISLHQKIIDSSNNSTSHLMPSCHLNKLVGFPSTALKNIFSNNTHHNYIHNDNYTDLKVSLGQNPRIKLDTSLGYDLKGGTHLFLLNTPQRDHCINFVKNIELTLDSEICTIAKLVKINSSFGVDFFLLKTNLQTNFKLELITYSESYIKEIIAQAPQPPFKRREIETSSAPATRSSVKPRQVGSVPREQVDTIQSIAAKGPPADPPDRVHSTNE